MSISEENQIHLVKSIQAPIEIVFNAFTNATLLRRWLCDYATAVPSPGGRIYLWWNSGYYSCGEYRGVETNQNLAFTWNGQAEPAATQVFVGFESQRESTRLTLNHSGLGTDTAWENISKKFQKDWSNALDNLASVLEIGQDLRLVRRPMLGISVAEFNTSIARKLGVPVSDGLRIDAVVEGMGAQEAGLSSDDVIVAINGNPLRDFYTLSNALKGKQANDVVNVDYYRGPEKKTTKMKLSARPIPTIPESAQVLADSLQKEYDQALKEVDRALDGASGEKAGEKPSPDSWSAKEIIAHLIHDERDKQGYIRDLISSQEKISDSFADNSDARVAATVAVYGSIENLMTELRRNAEETVEFVRRLPQDFVEQKANYWLMTFNLTQTAPHIRSHVDQIRAALEAAKT